VVAIPKCIAFVGLESNGGRGNISPYINRNLVTNANSGIGERSDIILAVVTIGMRLWKDVDIDSGIPKAAKVIFQRELIATYAGIFREKRGSNPETNR
jgi:hypothetical protein